MAHPGPVLPVVLCRQDCHPLDLPWLELTQCLWAVTARGLKTTDCDDSRFEEHGLTRRVAWHEEALWPCSPLVGAVGREFCSASGLPRELVLLWPAVCRLVAKVCGRALCCRCDSRQGGRCVYGLVLKHSLVFAEITVLYTHEMEVYFKHIITCNATKSYTD